MNPDVLILGAGAAGLAAANILSDHNRKVLILEARDRIGGRIYTLHDPKLKTPIELGAEFIHGRPDVTWNLLRQFNLKAFDIPFNHKRRHAGKLVDLADINHELRKVVAGLTHLGKHDESFADYLRRQNAKYATPEARQFALSFIQGFDAADPERISAKAIAEEQRGIGNVEDEPQHRLLEGYGTLIDHLRRSLNRERIKFRLKYSVSQITWSKSKVEIQSQSSRQTFWAPRVIITLPLGVLQLSPETAGAVRFAPDIPDWRAHALQLVSGPIVKAIIRFREPFWEDDEDLRDLSFIHDPASPFPTWWTMRPLHLPFLTAWAGGPKATALAGKSKRDLQHIAIDSLASLMNRTRNRLAGLVEHFYFHDWAADPFSRGAYSYVTVGGTHARPKLAKPILNTLYFAGEALDTTGQASTVAGALSSGQRAAQLVLKSL